MAAWFGLNLEIHAPVHPVIRNYHCQHCQQISAHHWLPDFWLRSIQWGLGQMRVSVPTEGTFFSLWLSKVFYLISLLWGKALAMPYTKLEGSLKVIFDHPDYSGNASGCPACWFSTWETALWLSTRWILVDVCCRSRASNTWSNTLGGLEECSYVRHFMLNPDLITEFHHVNAERPSESPGGSDWGGVLPLPLTSVSCQSF